MEASLEALQGGGVGMRGGSGLSDALPLSYLI